MDMRIYPSPPPVGGASLWESLNALSKPRRKFKALKSLKRGRDKALQKNKRAFPLFYFFMPLLCRCYASDESLSEQRQGDELFLGGKNSFTGKAISSNRSHGAPGSSPALHVPSGTQKDAAGTVRPTSRSKRTIMKSPSVT